MKKGGTTDTASKDSTAPNLVESILVAKNVRYVHNSGLITPSYLPVVPVIIHNNNTT